MKLTEEFEQCGAYSFSCNGIQKCDAFKIYCATKCVHQSMLNAHSWITKNEIVLFKLFLADNSLMILNLLCYFPNETEENENSPVFPFLRCPPEVLILRSMIPMFGQSMLILV